MVKKLATLLIAALAIGCHAQIPPATSHLVTLSWTAPVATSTWTGCTTAAPCVYAVYRCAGDATACATLTSTAWAEITTATTRPSGTSYKDTTMAAGASYTYVVETVQASTNSGPSNTTTANVPQTPVAPSIGTPTVAQRHDGPLPAPTMAPEMAKEAAVTDLHQTGE